MQLSPVFKIVRLFMEVSRILYLCFSSTRQLKKKKDKERWIDIEIENTELSALYEHQPAKAAERTWRVTVAPGHQATQAGHGSSFVVYRVSSKQTKKNSVQSETNRNKICFGFVSVCFVKPKTTNFGLFRFVSLF